MIAVNLLKEFAFFKDFSSDQLKNLASLATEESHLAGEYMYKGSLEGVGAQRKGGKKIIWREKVG